MKFGWRELWRISLWAVAACIAMTVAVFAAGTELGRGRLYEAYAEVREIFIPTGIKPLRPLDAREGRRLADTVRSLTAQREQLLARVDALEQSLAGVTGSVAQVEKSVQALQKPPEVAAAPVQPAAPAAEEVTGSIRSPADVPLPPAPPNKPEFGLDLGSASTVDALRTAWTTATRRYAALLDGLQPLVQVRERRQAPAEFRLIAGPIATASAAARICATITVGGGICAPTAFEGQRLAVR
jgi:hypothetical protein